MKLKRYVIVSASLLTLTAQALAQDCIYEFRTGNTYRGMLISIEDGILTFKAEDGKVNRARMASVASIRSAAHLDVDEESEIERKVAEAPPVQEDALLEEVNIGEEYGEPEGKYTISELKERLFDLQGKLIKLEFSHRGNITQKAEDEFHVQLGGCEVNKSGYVTSQVFLYDVIFTGEALDTIRQINDAPKWRNPSSSYLFGLVSTGGMQGVTFRPVGRRIKKKPGGKIEYIW